MLTDTDRFDFSIRWRYITDLAQYVVDQTLPIEQNIAAYNNERNYL